VSDLASKTSFIAPAQAALMGHVAHETPSALLTPPSLTYCGSHHNEPHNTGLQPTLLRCAPQRG
jgi:hypothetical protein